MNLTAEQFDEFFEAVHNAPDAPAEKRVRPFPWQSMLAQRVAERGWPRGIDLPTASGKTACLDIAVYTLALSARNTNRLRPRRVFFVVDRRIVMDEAYIRAKKLACALRRPQSAIVAEVADRLCDLAGTDEPLAVSRMRGGIAREDAWVSSPAQPAIITSTVDQAGSRLLFRGYGPGELSQSIHAALVGCDSLIVLDEAHCAVPFLQTAQAVARYGDAEWAEEPIARPLRFVVLSATLPPEIGQDERFPGDPGEREKALDHEELRRRTKTPKTAPLKVAEKDADAGTGDSLTESATKEAREMMSKGRRRVAVMVNRVAAAAAIFDQLTRSLTQGAADVVLMTGRMRPYDRDLLVERWSPVLKLNPEREPERPVALVTTQCLEVGADFSFDGLITECASLDALRQRFGRLNRKGDPNLTTSAVILMRPELIRAERGKDGIEKLEKDGEELDPIYGNALSRTWNWLTQNKRSEVDMSTTGVEKVLQTNLPEGGQPKLLAPSPDAPVLLPAHLDLLCQTAPRPEPDPDVSVFLHGPQRGAPEARVVFRADLVWNGHMDEEANKQVWLDAVSLVPPVSTEALRVPLPRLRAWLAGEVIKADQAGDVEGQPAVDDDAEHQTARPFVLWRGRRRSKGSKVSRDPEDVRPEDMVVVEADPSWARGLGHYFNIPPGQPLDIAEAAYLRSGKRAVLRVCESLLRPWKAVPQVNHLLAWASDEERDDTEARELVKAIQEYVAEDQGAALPDWIRGAAEHLLHGLRRPETHPSGGVIFFERRPGETVEPDEFADVDDTSSLAESCITLTDHTNAVVEAVRQFVAPARSVLPASSQDDLLIAARLHDSGKADGRFQTLLLGRIPTPRDTIVAKSDGLPRSPSKKRRIQQLSELPDEFRHEMVSVQLAEVCADLPSRSGRRDLILHLIASHHGHGRPFAPVCADEDPPDVQVELDGPKLELAGSDRSTLPPPHRADSGVADRFWRLTRRHGWWGLAYLETILRLADWHASEGAPQIHPRNPGARVASGKPRRANTYNEQPPLTLPGLDGSNPLAFLAALGTLRGLTRAWPEKYVRMSWTESAGAWRPRLHFAGSDRIITEPESVSALNDALADAKRIDFAAFDKNLKMTPENFRESAKQKLENKSGRREASDIIAALATDGAVNRDGNVSSSLLQMVNGGKHQDYLVIIRTILTECSEAHLQNTLFEQWRYADPLANLSLRWDPRDDRRHAYRWDDPSDAGTRRSGSQLGANRLALEALPLFTVCETRRRAATVAFSLDGRNFVWPIWIHPLCLDVVRSLLTLAKPEAELNSGERAHLRQLGIAIVFRARRFAVDKFQTASFAFAEGL